MDILLNAANAALLLAHDIRRDAEIGLLLLGPPTPPRLVRLVGFLLKPHHPDARPTPSLTRRALVEPPGVEHKPPPGVSGSIATSQEALDLLAPTFVSLRGGGKNTRQAPLPADAT